MRIDIKQSDLRRAMMGIDSEKSGARLKPVGHEQRILAHQERVQAALATMPRPCRRGPIGATKKCQIRRLRKTGISFAEVARVARVSEKTARKYGKERTQ